MKHLISLTLSFLILANIQAQQPVRLKKAVVTVWNSSTNSYITRDSTLYYYGGNNTGYLNNELFHNQNGFPWVEFINENSAAYLSIQPNMLFDSAIRHKQFTTSFMLHGKYEQTLTSNKISQHTRYGYHPLNKHWFYDKSFRNVYTGNLLTQQVDSGLNNNIKRNTYKYVNNNPLTPDSMIATYPGGQATHTYTYSNNLLTEINTYYNIGTHYKYVYSYSSGMPVNIATLFYNTNTTNWDTQIVQKYTYNNNNLMTRHEYWTDTILTFTVDAQYDNNNNRIEDIIHFNDGKLPNIGLVKQARKQYTYNNFGLIAEYKLNHWDSATQTWMPGADSLFGISHTVKLEYEVYWPAGVSATVKDSDNITIYPSPAVDIVSVKMPDVQAGDVNMSIHNMNGQTMRVWKDKADNQGYNRTIPVPELPTGMYILRLNGQHTSVSKQFSITK